MSKPRYRIKFHMSSICGLWFTKLYSIKNGIEIASKYPMEIYGVIGKENSIVWL